MIKLFDFYKKKIKLTDFDLDFSLDFNLDKNNLYNNLIFLDNASTSLTPNSVLEKELEFYKKYKSNIHRGLYKTAEKASDEYDNSRLIMANFLNTNKDEIIWTSGATDSSNKLINIIEQNLKSTFTIKNEIVVVEESHHSELVPIQEFAIRNNLHLKYGIDNINHKTLFVSIPMASNVTGEVFDIKRVSQIARSFEALIFVDFSAAAGHIKIDIQDMNIDAGYFSLHKMFGPNGVGVLYIKRELSRKFKPVYFGGGMVWEVTKDKTNYRSDIEAFEAGTPNIPGIIASSESVKYINKIGIDNIYKHNQNLIKYTISKLEDLNRKYLFLLNDNDDINKVDSKSYIDNEINYKNNETNNKDNISKNIEDKSNNDSNNNLYTKNILNIYSEKDENKNIGIISFAIKDIHSHDIAQILADNNIAVRAGSHCAQLAINKFSVNSMTRISLHIYNTQDHIDKLIIALEKVFTKFYKVCL